MTERVSYDGGVRDKDTDKPDFTLLFPENVPHGEQFLTTVARVMTEKAAYYGSRNWEAFASQEPLDHAKRSLMRHVTKLVAGETDEEHLALAAINLLFIHTIAYKMGAAQGSTATHAPDDVIRGDLYGTPYEYNTATDDFRCALPPWRVVRALLDAGLDDRYFQLCHAMLENGRCACCRIIQRLMDDSVCMYCAMDSLLCCKGDD
jgi:hypothetical protein